MTQTLADLTQRLLSAAKAAGADAADAVAIAGTSVSIDVRNSPRVRPSANALMKLAAVRIDEGVWPMGGVKSRFST